MIVLFYGKFNNHAVQKNQMINPVNTCFKAQKYVKIEEKDSSKVI